MNIFKEMTSYIVSYKNKMFEFIESSHTRRMIENGYQAVNSLELWDFLSKFEPEEGKGFMFTDHHEINRIGEKMEELPNSPGHSGASFACTMRHLQYIAKHGLDKYKRDIHGETPICQ